DQVNLFGVYGARHINVEFDEPLIDEEVPRHPERSEGPGGAGGTRQELRTSQPPRSLGFARDDGERNPLVILSGLAPVDRTIVRDFVLRSNATVYAEPVSGLREELADIAIHNERTLQRGNFDLVIRIGNVPTLRYWRDLESKSTEIMHFSRLPF